MADDRLAHEIRLQAKQIEQVFDHHELDVHVVGGAVRQNDQRRETSFDVRGKLAAGLAQVRTLKEDLQKALGQGGIEVARRDGRLQVHVTRSKAGVSLLEVLAQIPDVPPMTAVLGWTADDEPVLLDFQGKDAHHVLIAGYPKAGKTMLLRTMAVSLALTNKERDLQLVLVSPSATAVYDHTELAGLDYLPHMLTPIATDVASAHQVLKFLVDEVQLRAQEQVSTPAIVVLIDDLVELVALGNLHILEPLAHLIRRGAASGIHVVMATNRAEATILQDVHDAYVPARLVGQVGTAVEAEIAADALDSRAERLQGQGDFLAVVGMTMTHFQVAHLNDYDLHLCLERLYGQRAPALLAQSMVSAYQTHRFENPTTAVAADFVEEVEPEDEVKAVVLEEVVLAEAEAEMEDVSFEADMDVVDEIVDVDEAAMGTTAVVVRAEPRCELAPVFSRPNVDAPKRIGQEAALPECEDGVDDLIPFTWESPRFEAAVVTAQEPDAPAPILDELEEVGRVPEVIPARPVSPQVKKRFKSVQNLLNQIEAHELDDVAQEMDGRPEAKVRREPAPLFRPVAAQAQSLAKRVGADDVEVLAEDEPVEVPVSEDEVTLEAFDDGWHLSESESEDGRGESESPESATEDEDEDERGRTTRRILNGDKPAPPLYPLPSKRQLNKHKLQ